MENDVFISYATTDKHIADAVCSSLENGGVRCWIAPRDIVPGSDWASCITNAIKSSKIMILIFSHNSNESNQVTKELNLAVSNKLMIVPFKIDDSTPSGSMEYFLADRHWLDAINGDIQEQITRLKNIIVSILPHNIKTETASATSEPVTPPQEPVAAPQKTNVDNADYSFEEVAKDFSQQPQESDTSHADHSFHDSTSDFSQQHQASSIDTSGKKVGLLQAYRLLWSKCFCYQGCSSRAEYWKAVLANVIVFVILFFVNAVMFPDAPTLIQAYLLIASIPFLSLGVRRLHDTNRSGHWMWLCLTGYGSIALLVFFCFESVTQNNRFKA